METKSYPIDDVINDLFSNYRGSRSTYHLVCRQIRDRWGDLESQRYDPYKNCLTFKQWSEKGYRIKKSEKALKSFTIVEKKDALGRTARKFFKTVNLFYYLQVEKSNY